MKHTAITHEFPNDLISKIHYTFIDIKHTFRVTNLVLFYTKGYKKGIMISRKNSLHGLFEIK